MIWRIGLACVNRPYLARSVDSLIKGLEGFNLPYSVELFDGVGDPSYLKPITEKYPRIIIHSDGKKRGVVQNFYWLWQTISVDTVWSMMFPDDFTVCRDFMLKAHLFCERFKAMFDVFSFWTPYQEVCRALKEGKPYWIFPNYKFYGGIGLAFKSEVLSELCEYTKSRKLYEARKGADMIIKQFLIVTRRNVCAHVPNLCQHIGVTSTIGNAWRNRIAPCSIAEG